MFLLIPPGCYKHLIPKYAGCTTSSLYLLRSDFKFLIHKLGKLHKACTIYAPLQVPPNFI